MKSKLMIMLIQGLVLSLIQTALAFSGSGSGTESDPYIITNVDELQEMQLGLSVWYELGNDIDASDTVNWNTGTGFDPVGDSSHGFTGHLNGNDFTISGLYIYKASTSYIGLFGKIHEGAVENLSLTDSDITGNYYTGGLVGYNYYGSITNCTSAGSVTGTGNYYTGGLVGGNSYGDITNCTSAGSVTGSGNYSYYTGGLVGYNYGDIANCHSQANVTGSDEDTGGLVGYNDGDITVCNSAGNVTGTNHVGGSVGWNRGNISDCSSTGSVFGTDQVGGFVGENYSASIQGCYSTGNVNGAGIQCGGFVGYSDATITNCFAAIGDVTGNAYVGGFAGENAGTTTNCYSAGPVTATSNVGGFTGWCDGACNDCFWNTETSGHAASACGTGKTTAEMQQEATFNPPWDFGTVWGIDEDETYPQLKWAWPTCGNPWHPYPIGDVNHDCHVDFQDFALMASHWLESTPGI